MEHRLCTVAQAAGLRYIALAGASAQAGEFEPLARQFVGTVQFPIYCAPAERDAPTVGSTFSCDSLAIAG